MALLDPGTNLARYTILGKLATGGMSEVYLARQSGPSGFSKILVLKVILPHLCEDPEFVSMFHNEAKLAALLNHPNVVQIFDFSVSEEAHFMAMEYIDGQDLGRIVHKLQQEDSLLPAPEALRIISDACGALEYAHSFTDPGGTHLEIIHRDVSLDNILVTYSGQVKLVDFGIAKARNVESHTAVGTLRGKFNYMAPELLMGEKLDNRVDIFSMGVVLYRTLLGEMPFQGDNHAQLINAIVHKTPRTPREVKPDLPEELERVILRSLAKDRDQRYQRCGEIQIDLEAYLLGEGKAVMPYHLAQFMSSVFPPGSDTARERYRKLAGITTSTPGGEVKSRPTRPVQDDRPTARIAPTSKTPSEQSSSLLFKSTMKGDDEDPEESAPSDTAKMIEANTMIATEDEIGFDPDELVLDEVDLLEDDDISELDGIPSSGDLRDAAARLRAPTSVFERTPGKAPVRATDETSLDVEVEGALADLDTAELDGALSTLRTNALVGGDLSPEEGLLGGDTPVDDLAGYGPLKEVSTADEPTRVQDVQVFDLMEGDPEPGGEQTSEHGLHEAVTSISQEISDADIPEAVPLEQAPMAIGDPATITQDVPAQPPTKPRSSLMFLVLGALVLCGGGAGIYYFGFHPRTPSASPDSGVIAGTVEDGAPAPDPDQRAPEPAREDAAAQVKPDSAQVKPDSAQVKPDSAQVKPDSRVRKKPDSRVRKKPDSRVRKEPDSRVRKKPPVKPRTGQLSVTATLGGEVYLGRRRLGSLPLKGITLKPGRHRVQVRSRRLGYRIYRTITLKAGGHQRLHIAPRKGTISIKVRPWARVTLDGKLLGTTPIPSRKVYEGFHVLELANDNPGSKKKMRVKVEPGKETVLKVRMDQ